MKLSKHSKMRMIQRANVTRNQREFFRNALTYGISAGETNDEKIKKYLSSIEKNNSKVKLYKGYVFVYSKNAKQLYTMYELPKRFLKGDEEDGK